MRKIFLISVFSLALAACGGGGGDSSGSSGGSGGSSSSDTPSGGGGATQGISPPGTVSVVPTASE